MQLSILTDAFAKLEATSSRLASVDILAELLNQADPDDLELIVNLTLGQLRPPYEGIVLGIAEKSLIPIVAQAFHRNGSEILRLFKRKGDLGTVAESLGSDPARQTITVRNAFDSLMELAKSAGKDSIKRKSGILAELLSNATKREAKYLVRIVEGKLRLGIGEQTIIEAIACGALDDREKKQVIERAYNVRSDLGGIARLAYLQGERGLRGMEPQIGTPIRPALAQRLSSATEIVQRLGTVLAEPKYDGFRLQLHLENGKVLAFSRRMDNVTSMFPDIMRAVLYQVKARTAILEGEAIVHNPETGEFLPFQETVRRKRKYQIEEMTKRYPLRLFAFDLLYLNGMNLIPVPLHKRRMWLQQIISSDTDRPLAVTSGILTNQAEVLQGFFEEMIERGLEGIIAKRPDTPYHAGARNYNWVKLKRGYQAKLADTLDLTLIGYLSGRGKRAELKIGSLLGAVYDPESDRFRSVARIGSGLTEKQWKELRGLLDRIATKKRPKRVDSVMTPDVWVEPRYVVTVFADEITRSPMHTCGKTGKLPGYALRFPRVIESAGGFLRTDKAPEDATTEDEILKMYKIQSKPHR